MGYLKIPLEISKGRVDTIADEKESIDKYLAMFLNTSKWSVAADPEYGFEFVGLRFEIFDENSGTVYNSDTDSGRNPLYKKKISGSSKNMDTFASDLNSALREYEPRLRDLTTNMTYIRESKVIIIFIRGTMVKTGKPYEYTNILKVWS